MDHRGTPPPDGDFKEAILLVDRINLFCKRMLFSFENLLAFSTKVFNTVMWCEKSHAVVTQEFRRLAHCTTTFYTTREQTNKKKLQDELNHFTKSKVVA